MPPAEFCVVMITVPNGDEGERIARALVSERLAACVNILDGVQSVFRWQGKIENDRESLLIVKTSSERFQRLEERVRGMHPYDVPEIVAVDLARCSDSYAAFLGEALQGET